MPNGRSGAFVIDKADLKRLVKALPDATVVGEIFALSMPIQPRPADALETARLLDLWTNARMLASRSKSRTIRLTSSISAMNPKSSGWWLVQRRRFSWNSANGTSGGRLSTQTGMGGPVSDTP